MSACNWPGDSPCDRPGCPSCARSTCAWECYREATTERGGKPTCRQCARGFDESAREDMHADVVEYYEDEHELVAAMHPGVRAHWRHVGIDEIGASTVSTVFLGLDHAHNGGPPVLWETMVFGGDLDGEQERYTSRADAVAGHAAMVARVKS